MNPTLVPDVDDGEVVAGDHQLHLDLLLRNWRPRSEACPDSGDAGYRMGGKRRTDQQDQILKQVSCNFFYLSLTVSQMS